MSANLNTVVLVGNLTRDPEVRSTGSGTTVVTLGLAVNERYKSGDDWQEYVSFFDITVWGAKGQACADHLSKGSPVAVHGRLKQERWEKEGQKRSKVGITAREVQFLPSKNSGGGGGGDSSAYKEEGPDFDPGTGGGDIAAGGNDNDDIPF